MDTPIYFNETNFSTGIFTGLGTYANTMTNGWFAPSLSILTFLFILAWLFNTNYRQHAFTIAFFTTTLMSLALTALSWLNPFWILLYLAGFLVSLWASSQVEVR
jgi:uncharacterized membrane protein (DUF106 family)